MPKTIVIVEDEPILLKALNIELLSEHFKIFSAVDGISALKLIRQKLPDLVLLDLFIPKLSGFEVINQLKHDHKTSQIPIIVLSNLTQKEEIERAMELGADEYFIKSDTDLKQVLAKINSTLKK